MDVEIDALPIARSILVDVGMLLASPQSPRLRDRGSLRGVSCVGMFAHPTIYSYRCSNNMNLWWRQLRTAYWLAARTFVIQMRSREWSWSRHSCIILRLYNICFSGFIKLDMKQVQFYVYVCFPSHNLYSTVVVVLMNDKELLVRDNDYDIAYYVLR